MLKRPSENTGLCHGTCSYGICSYGICSYGMKLRRSSTVQWEGRTNEPLLLHKQVYDKRTPLLAYTTRGRLCRLCMRYIQSEVKYAHPLLSGATQVQCPWAYFQEIMLIICLTQLIANTTANNRIPEYKPYHYVQSISPSNPKFNLISSEIRKLTICMNGLMVWFWWRTPKLMIVGTTSSPEPSNHSAVRALPSNMWLGFPNKASKTSPPSFWGEADNWAHTSSCESSAQ